MFQSILSVLTLSGLALAAPTGAAANCTRELLQDATAGYVTAQTSGKYSAITALGNSSTYTENFKTVAISTGVLSKALKIDHRRSTYDTTACASYTELIVADSAAPYVLGTQLRLTDNKITKVDTIVTKPGDWLFNATGTLYWATHEDGGWGTIAAEKRDTRAVIQAAADAYLDIFKDKSVKVPWGTPCARLEGGMYTGKGTATDKCDVGIPDNIDLVNRRYVIDETLGAVDVFLNFAGPTGRPDSHEFRVEAGKLRYVHTLTNMT